MLPVRDMSQVTTCVTQRVVRARDFDQAAIGSVDIGEWLLERLATTPLCVSRTTDVFPYTTPGFLVLSGRREVR